MIRDDWRSLSGIFAAIQRCMVTGWTETDERRCRADLCLWLRDHDMPCEMLEKTAETGNDWGCRGMSLDVIQTVEFDAESGELLLGSLAWLYFSSVNYPFIVRVRAVQNEPGDYHVSFEVRTLQPRENP